MPVLGVTGGVGCGKTTFSRLLGQHLGAPVIEVDAVVRWLLAEDVGIRDRVRAAFGDGVVDPEGRVDRSRLRAIVFADSDRRRTLEAMIHPVVREHWLRRARPYREAAEWLVVDIPLLYETGAETLVDAVAVVACGRETQMARLTGRRGLAAPVAAAIIAAQHDLNEKMRRAEFAVWNEADLAALDEQATLVAAALAIKR